MKKERNFYNNDEIILKEAPRTLKGLYEIALLHMHDVCMEISFRFKARRILIKISHKTSTVPYQKEREKNCSFLTKKNLPKFNFLFVVFFCVAFYTQTSLFFLLLWYLVIIFYLFSRTRQFSDGLDDWRFRLSIFFSRSSL